MKKKSSNKLEVIKNNKKIIEDVKANVKNIDEEIMETHRKISLLL